MATNEIPASHIDNDNSSSSNNQNYNMVDIPLYAESKMTRKQAIREILDVILRSNMKPRSVKYTLHLLQKLLPSNNTLPVTTDELFGAMMSSENDWRLAQYLIKHKQCPSFLSSSNLWNEHSNMSTTATSPLPMRRQQELNISTQSSSSSDDQNNELSPYERLQQCLRPITDIAREFNLNYATTLPLTINNMNSNNIPLFDQRSQLSSNSINPSNFLKSFKRSISESSSITSTSERDLFYTTRIFDENDTDNEISLYSTSNNNNKLCCFEINGYDLLNGSKRRRYY